MTSLSPFENQRNLEDKKIKELLEAAAFTLKVPGKTGKGQRGQKRQNKKQEAFEWDAFKLLPNIKYGGAKEKWQEEMYNYKLLAYIAANGNYETMNTLYYHKTLFDIYELRMYQTALDKSQAMREAANV